jgi:hypothetical protein
MEKDAEARLQLFQLTAGSFSPKPAASTNGGRRKVLLPQGATPADRKILTGVIALLFAAMCTLTMMLWRSFRRVHASPRRIRRRS